jgi:hypothetical protein
MWDPRHLTTLQASAACYGGRFYFTFTWIQGSDLNVTLLIVGTDIVIKDLSKHRNLGSPKTQMFSSILILSLSLWETSNYLEKEYYYLS